MKRHYRRQLLRKLLIEGAEDEELVLANHQQNKFKGLLHGSGSFLVTPVTLRRAWNKLKGLPSEEEQKKDLKKMRNKNMERMMMMKMRCHYMYIPVIPTLTLVLSSPVIQEAVESEEKLPAGILGEVEVEAPAKASPVTLGLFCRLQKSPRSS
ncbi:hypothetical protein EVAR_96660_1 [Eumeta japonica]|uniref:Uncharacterized protein n=1 Tax=Eumeta variegata TaxID=151549 RepID=A0A4C1STW2_EUMVA|nr:hypothetical protein EVAR_96660_1 [Eumeta japonica]